MSHFSGFLVVICMSTLVGSALGSFATMVATNILHQQGAELRQVIDAVHEDVLYLRRDGNDVNRYAQLMAELYEQRITEIWAVTPAGEKTFEQMSDYVPRRDFLDRETTVWAYQRYSDSLRALEDAYATRGLYPDRSLVVYDLFRYLNYLAVATTSGYMRVGDFSQMTERLENYMDVAPRPDPLSRAVLQEVRSIVNRNG